MRKIEKTIMARIEEGKDLLGNHDRVIAVAKRWAVYSLLGTEVAKIEGPKLSLGTPRGDWQTNTTKSRINAFSTHFQRARHYSEIL